MANTITGVKARLSTTKETLKTKKSLFAALNVTLLSAAMFSVNIVSPTPAIAGCSLREKESEVHSKYNGLYKMGHQYNLIQTIPLAADIYLTGGKISEAWASSELKKVSIDSVKFLVQNDFDPSKDVLIGDILTFQCWANWAPKHTRYNIFKPYIAIRRQEPLSSQGTGDITTVSYFLTKGIDTGRVYSGSAKVFSCPEGKNMNSGSGEGISAFCVVNNNFDQLVRANDTGREYKGGHKVYTCLDGGINSESSRKEGIFSACFNIKNKSFFGGQYTGQVYNGDYRIFRCPKGSLNLESGNAEGISQSCLSIR